MVCKEIMQLASDLETVFWCSYDIDPLRHQKWHECNCATYCHICKQPFISNEKKFETISISHLNNRGNKKTIYMGVVARNLNFQENHIVRVIFHNLSRYDRHIIMEKIPSYISGQIDYAYDYANENGKIHKLHQL